MTDGLNRVDEQVPSGTFVLILRKAWTPGKLGWVTSPGFHGFDITIPDFIYLLQYLLCHFRWQSFVCLMWLHDLIERIVVNANTLMDKGLARHIQGCIVQVLRGKGRTVYCLIT